ncbi:MAG TPA: FkbM family methyltransferase [Pseudolabrys sp.]|nr:FkbM family methyltransferase [Pseudolabrys sp.]
MRNVGRKLAFVLTSTNHGSLIVNRFDYRMTGPDRGIGVGHQLLETATFDPVEIELALQLIDARRRIHGDGVVAIDGGANIGVHAIEWATAMTGWGSVIAIEAQERIYYALAGNIAINNCFNAIAMHAAISSEQGIMLIPTPDYFVPSSFGSLELKPRAETEFIGQPIDYSPGNTVAIQKLSIDALNLPRVDFIKLDIEGMELEALEGARQTIERSHPIFLVESIKAGRERLRMFFHERGYKVVEAGINLLAIHKSDPVVNELQIPDMPAQPSAA